MHALELLVGGERRVVPRKMRGVVSQGMLFDLGFADGITPVLATPESPVPDGTRAG